MKAPCLCMHKEYLLPIATAIYYLGEKKKKKANQGREPGAEKTLR